MGIERSTLHAPPKFVKTASHETRATARLSASSRRPSISPLPPSEARQDLHGPERAGDQGDVLGPILRAIDPRPIRGSTRGTGDILRRRAMIVCLQPLDTPHELGDIGQRNGVETRVPGNGQSARSRQRGGRRNDTRVASPASKPRCRRSRHPSSTPASLTARLALTGGGPALATRCMEPRRPSRWWLPCGSLHGRLVARPTREPAKRCRTGDQWTRETRASLSPRLGAPAGGDGCPGCCVGGCVFVW